jgi:nitroimidazol reductase NimA-like FMN-containing flavoprotein (pyridoxamine 5'-phosphate oxidase superfamily)
LAVRVLEIFNKRPILGRRGRLFEAERKLPVPLLAQLHARERSAVWLCRMRRWYPAGSGRLRPGIPWWEIQQQSKQEEDALMDELPQTERTTLRRLPKRGVYDRDLIHAILDEGLICHLGFVVASQPFVIPTIHVRVGQKLYVHGSPASRMLQTLEQGVEVCVAVTLVDGLVLARSAFHHSMNYRSAVVFGKARPVESSDEKLEVLQAFSEHLIKERWREVRRPSPAELKGTLVLSLPIDEASAKVRTGPPVDDEEDYGLAVSAGILPLKIVPAEPVADPRLPEDIAPPHYVVGYRGPGPLA